MEISKENIFNVKYTSVLGEKTNKDKKWTSSILEFIHNNKLITITLIIFVMCLSLNFILIYNFMKILENI